MKTIQELKKNLGKIQKNESYQKCFHTSRQANTAFRI